MDEGLWRPGQIASIRRVNRLAVRAALAIALVGGFGWLVGVPEAALVLFFMAILTLCLGALDAVRRAGARCF